MFYGPSIEISQANESLIIKLVLYFVTESSKILFGNVSQFVTEREHKMTMFTKTIRAKFKQIFQSTEFYGLSLKLSQEKGAISEFLA